MTTTLLLSLNFITFGFSLVLSFYYTAFKTSGTSSAITYIFHLLFSCVFLCKFLEGKLFHFRNFVNFYC